jgi:hypothetical protein
MCACIGITDDESEMGPNALQSATTETVFTEIIETNSNLSFLLQFAISNSIIQDDSVNDEINE